MSQMVVAVWGYNMQRSITASCDLRRKEQLSLCKILVTSTTDQYSITTRKLKCYAYFII